MFVEKWMTRNPVTVLPHVSISSVAMEMGRQKFRHLLVAEPTAKGKKLVGIVSKYDIGRAFPPNLNPFSLAVDENTVPGSVSSIMTRNVLTTTPGSGIDEAASILRTHRVDALPVMRDNILVGIITESDIFDAFLAMMSAKKGTMRLIVESDPHNNPVPLVVELSRENKVKLLSILSFHEDAIRPKDLSIFCFGSSFPADCLQALRKYGCRIMSISG